MAFEIPGFVDDHVHLVESSVSGDLREQREDPETLHHEMERSGTTPMDELDNAGDLPGDIEDRILHLLDGASALGLRRITETGMGDARLWDALLRLRERGTLPLAVHVFMASGEADMGMPSRTGEADMEMVGVKFYVDGWLGTRTCAVNAPFADRPDTDGVLFMDAVTLARRAEPYASAGWRVATHAIGDRAVDAVLDAYEMIYGSDCSSQAPRIEHCSIVTDAAIQRMAEIGVVACIQPSFARSDAATAASALGARRRLAYRWNEMLDAGVRMIAGSDSPIESLDPLVGLRDLTAVQDDNARLDIDAALRLITDAESGVTRLSDDPRLLQQDEWASISVL